MNGDDLFTGNGKDAVDQWTLDQTIGAAAALQTHWVCVLSHRSFLVPITSRNAKHNTREIRSH